MKVAHFMTSSVIAVAPKTRVVDAARLMVEKRISGLAVVEPDGALVGVLTEGDLLRRAELGTDRRQTTWFESLFGSGRRAEDYARSHGVLVEEVMTRNPLTCAPEDDLADVIASIVSRGVKRVIVIDSGRPVGVLSRADVVRAFLASVDENRRAAAPSTDADAERRIRDSLQSEAWAPRKTVSFDVRDGQVFLSGSVTDPRQREALIVLVENAAPGFPVVDRLVWIEPYSGSVVETFK